MEEQILDSEELEYTHQPKIYSQRVIMGFSVFFSPFVGGILTSMNLNAVGKRTEANYVMMGTVIYFILTMAFLTSSDSIGQLTSLLPNIIGGAILAYVVQDRYIPDHKDHPKRPWWKPFVICSAIVVAAIAITYFLMPVE